ncbi:hypothetical protein [Streptomyces sp. Tue6028]|uniref:hypothetical protein n=1 Tax=Streptomyces sp. Tue6028 TaxID=2036037 RepID=UPI003EB83893
MLALRLDEFLDGLRVGVAEVVAFELVAGEALDEGDGFINLAVGHVGCGGREVVGAADLVGPAHRMKHDRVLADPQQAEALASRPRVRGRRGIRGPPGPVL